MNPQLFKNVNLFDGERAELYPAEVLVENSRITKVAPGGGISTDGVDVVDGGGQTLMPGLVEAHAHVTYTNFVYLRELGQVPPEEHVLITAQNAKLMLDSGFTSLYSAASSKPRTEIVIRNAINAGTIPGPRMRAASPEIVSTGGLGDERQMHNPHHQGIEIVADGTDEIRKIVRTLIREGVDTIKMNISGDNFVRKGFGEQTAYTEAEVAACAEEAHARGAWLSCHARSDASVRLALKHGFRVIYHCDFIQGETFDLLEEAKDRVFLAPAIGIIYATAYEAEPWGITSDIARHMDLFKMLENCPIIYGELKKRGLRILPGGDYGFAWSPIGTNARDLEHFVNILGFSPADTLTAATKLGGQIMGFDDLGLVREGFLADLLLVNGDPLQDIKLFQDRDNISIIMKDGEYHKRSGSQPETADIRQKQKTASVWQ